MRRGGDDLARRLDPVAARHVEVHQHDVRVQLERARDRLLATRRLAGERDVVDRREQRGEAGAERLGVVGDEDAQLLGGHADDRTPARGPGQPPRHDFPVRSGHESLPAWVIRGGGWRRPHRPTEVQMLIRPTRTVAALAVLLGLLAALLVLRSSASAQDPGTAHAHAPRDRARRNVHPHPQHEGRLAALEPRRRHDRVRQPVVDAAGKRIGKSSVSCATTTGSRNFMKSALTCHGVTELPDGSLMLQAIVGPNAP